MRLFRQDRGVAVAAMVKFSALNRELAERTYDDLIGTFTRDGTVDEESQRNDLAIIRQITGVSEPVPISRAYDFSFARDADRRLTETGWRP